MKLANFFMPKNNSEPAAINRGPIGDIADAGNGAVVVTNYDDDTVSLLDATTLAVAGVVSVPGEPFAVAASDDRAYVSTSSETHDAVSVIDTVTRTVIATYELAFSVTALAVSPDGKRVYAGRTGDGYIDVAVIDTTAERVGTINIATGAAIGVDAMEVDATGKRLYVATTDARGSAVVVVDLETARIARTIPVGAPIRDLGLVDGAVYVLTSDRVRGGAVNVIDLSRGRITDTVELGIGAPTQLTMSGDKTRAYVVDYDRVTVLCALTFEILDTITVDARPSCVAIDSDNGRLYVADYSGNVTAFPVPSTMPQLYAEFFATDAVTVPEVRELEPVNA
jgi:YVTN family beta-propeller protein